MWKKLRKWLLTWKPIHLCWWFRARGKPIPKYFIGGGSTAPSVTTNAATNIGKVSAQLNGDVTSDGGDTITARGFVYSSTDSTPTIGESGVTNEIVSGTTGTYNATVTGLSANTTYYYQAYATNKKGTSYGGVQSFTTYSLVSVTLDSPANAATETDTTPDLKFTGSDAQHLDISYNLWLDPSSSFDSDSLIIDEHDVSNQTGSILLRPNPSYSQAGQSFEASANASLKTAKFNLQKTSNGVIGSLTSYLYSHDGTFGTSSLPRLVGGALATSDTINVADLGTGSFGMVSFNFPTPYDVTANEYYVIVLDATTVSGGTTEGVYIGNEAYPATHSGNVCAYVISWNVLNSDLIFQVADDGPQYNLLSDTDSGFSAPSDTDPFNAGSQVTYTVQSPLANGSYWWKVRGKDPSGSNEFGSFSSTNYFVIAGSAAPGAGSAYNTIIMGDSQGLYTTNYWYAL